MHIKDWKKEILTIPNMLSIFRLLLIPVYVTIYLTATSNTDYLLAALILGVSCLTDLIDGQIARHFNMISTLGKVLDPLADKATQLTLIICLTMRYWTLLILMAIFVFKEGFQALAGGLRLRKGRMLKGAQVTGKICTTILFISLLLMVMIPSMSFNQATVLVIIDAIFMIIAFVDYIIVYYRKDFKFQELDLTDFSQKNAPK